MNIRICTWLDESVTYNEDLLNIWNTEKWTTSCYDIKAYVSYEKNQNIQKTSSNISFEEISREKTIRSITNELYTNWSKIWLSKYKDFLNCVGIDAKPSDENNYEPCLQWLNTWLNFQSAYSAMDRYCTTYDGNEERDVVILCHPKINEVHELKEELSLFYRYLHDSYDKPSRTAGFYWTPLNGLKEAYYLKDNLGNFIALVGQDNTIRQIFNVHNLKLYFIGHFEMLNSAMKIDFDPISSVVRLLDVELIQLEEKLRKINRPD